MFKTNNTIVALLPMKSKTQPKPAPIYRMTYPVLMQSITSPSKGTIVLFTDPTIGMVIHSTIDDLPVGDYDDDWAHAYNRDEWSRYQGEVVLSNDDDQD